MQSFGAAQKYQDLWPLEKLEDQQLSLHPAVTSSWSLAAGPLQTPRAHRVGHDLVTQQQCIRSCSQVFKSYIS